MRLSALTEEQAVRSLKRLAKKWPSTLWLFAAAGSLHVMRRGPDGERVHVEKCEGYDPLNEVDQIDIPCDGGDW